MVTSIEAVRESIFGVFYIMTEQNSQQSKHVSFGTLRRFVLYLIDAGQVVRALVLPEFGWNSGVESFVKKFDFFGLIFDLVSPNFPRVPCYLTAVVLVALVLMNMAFVIRLFQKGRTSPLWPVMLLRTMISLLVTTFFVSVLHWLLFPVNCKIKSSAEPDTISTWLGREGAACTPWGSQEVAVTLLTLFLIVIFIVFSLVSNLLSFEISPISQTPADYFTGRVEALWTIVRVTAAVMVYIQAYITPVGALVFFCLQQAFVLAFHIKVLPFHSHIFNLLRAGIFAAALWTAISSALVSSFSESSNSSDVQWSLVAFTPIAFFLGVGATHWKKIGVLANIKRLRAEFARNSAGGATASLLGGPSSRQYSIGAPLSAAATATAAAAAAAKQAVRRDPFDEFYDAEARMSRAFESSATAHCAIRVLLRERDMRDIPLLAYLFERALEAHPKSQELLILHLVFLRFVFRDAQSAAYREKVTKRINSELRTDLKFALYAVDRKAFQYDAGLSLGKDSISAVNLMEVSTKLAHVRKKHQECIALLKGLWKIAGRTKRETSMAMAEQLIESFNKSAETIAHTKKCYEELLSKFSGSASLHLDFAHFCEAVLNDEARARKYRHGAEILETGDAVEVANEDAKSLAKSNHSSTASYRTAQRQFLESWSSAVMQSQSKSLARLKVLILGLTAFLLIFSVSGFVLLDVYLLSSVSETRLKFLDRTLSYFQSSIKACISLRSMHLERNMSDPLELAEMAEHRDLLEQTSREMHDMHTLNYVASPSQRVTDYFMDENLAARIAVPGAGAFESIPTNFWDLINQFISAFLSSSAISLDDLHGPDYTVNHMSLNKRAVTFVFENLWTVRDTMDIFFGILLDEIVSLLTISNIIVYCLLIVNIALLAFISFTVLRNVNSVFPTCQHCLVGGNLVHSLPFGVCNKILRFYMACEKSLAAIEDEDEAKKNIEQQADPIQSEDCDADTAAAVNQYLSDGGEESDDGGEDGDDDFDSGDGGDRRGGHGGGSLRSLVCGDEKKNMANRVTGQEAQQGCKGHSGGAELSTADSEDTEEEEADGGESRAGADPAMHSPSAALDQHSTSWKALVSGSRSRGGDGGPIVERVAPLTSKNVKHFVDQTSNPATPMHGSFADRSWKDGSKLIGNFLTKPGVAPVVTRAATGGAPAAGAPAQSASGGGAVLAREAKESDEAGMGVDRENLAAPARGRSVRSLYSSANSDGFEADADGGGGDLGGLEMVSVRGTDVVSDGGHHEALERRAFGGRDCNPRTGKALSRTASRKYGGKPAVDEDSFGRGGGEEEDEGAYERNSSRRSSGRSNPGGDGGRRSGDHVRRSGDHVRRSGDHARRSCVHNRRGGGQLHGKHTTEGEEDFGSSGKRVHIKKRLQFKGQSVGKAGEIRSGGGGGDQGSGGVAAAIKSLLKRTIQSSFQRGHQSTQSAGVVDSGQAGEATAVEAESFEDLVQRRTVANLAWFFRPTVHMVSLTFVLVLNDGFTRMNGSAILGHLRESRNDFLLALNVMRQGGYIPAESNTVRIGADTANSVGMATYNEIMYARGCPWRKNTTDCTIPAWPEAESEGLYKYLQSLHTAVGFIITKYSPDPRDDIRDPRFEWVELNATRADLLESDPDVQFVLYRDGMDALDGMSLLIKNFNGEQRRIMAEMHQEIQLLISLFIIAVLLSFYVILYRTAMAEAKSEVNKTRHFVSMIPLHILNREESETIMRFFVPDGPEEEDLASPGGNRQHDPFENAPLLSSGAGANGSGEGKRRQRPESEYGRAKLQPEGFV